MKSARVNMRIQEDLLEWVKEYAAENNTTVTQVFIDLLTKLKREWENEDL